MRCFAVITAVLVAVAAAADAPKGATPLLPDLIFDLDNAMNNVIDTTRTPGRIFFRFESSIANIGPGEFRVESTFIDAGNNRETVQLRTYNDDDSSFVTPMPNFLYRPSTRRMEVDGWVAYRIREWLPGDGVGPILRDDQKPVVNITSSTIYDVNVPNFTPPGQRISANGPVHGISVGWTDIYLRTMELQWVDITGLPVGTYWLELENDPAHTIPEANENNNIIRLKVLLNNPAMPLIQGDVNKDDTIDAVDIQFVINAALGTPVLPIIADINGDGLVDAIDIQFVINLALGIAQPLD